MVVEKRVKALGVMHVAEEGEVGAVFVDDGFEGVLAGETLVVIAAGGVPGSVAGDDEPPEKVSMFSKTLKGW